MVTLQDIQAAALRIGDVIYHSPCPYSLSLSKLCGCDIYCKLDHLQMTGSFKERGARNKLMQLAPPERRDGVVAASAGNHALGLAYHGQQLGIPVTVVMPRFAPLIKVANCRSFGAQVILSGDTFSDCYREAKELAVKSGKTFVPGFDDPAIIAGAGTMGLEIIADIPDADAVIVPVGGGGLLAGVATAIKGLKPACRVIGVEPRHAPTLFASLQAGRVTAIATRPTLADGLAVAEIGGACFDIIRHTMDDLVMVDEPQISLAVMRLLEMEKMVVEGAGAVPLAAAMRRTLGLEGKKVVLCLTGGNIDVTLISRIIERGLAADGRLCRVIAYISDRPGSLAHLLTVIAQTGASIKEVSHDRNFGPADVACVPVSIVMETRDASHIAEIRGMLSAQGFTLGDATLD
ncbi:MAG TPA: threonine ammonia-lyase [Tepidisphaeraceae bacterium]|jgi:threonine dehydratase|nr:threonine ammonia-lyase [Tepidisphaeraceae bacterium]